MGLSIWHILLFAVIVILLFGTSKLKNLGKDLGGAIKDFKDSVSSEEKAENLSHQAIKDVRSIELNKEKIVNYFSDFKFMFNISFGEILVFSILALIILGPEKLPQALRSAAIKYRNIKNAVNKIQQDFENELELVELKRLMEVELKKIKENEEHLKAQLTQMQNEIDQLNEDITLVDDKSKITYQYQLITSSPFQVPYLANQSFMFNVVRNAA